MPEADFVLLARIVRPQGRRGEVIAELLTDFPERFAERRKLYLLPGVSSPAGFAEPRPAELETYRLHQGRIVLKLDGVDSIAAAEALRGHLLALPAEQRAPLADDAVYIADLIGCRVLDASMSPPRDLGEIIDVQREPVTADLLVLQAEGDELLIPFAKAYLRSIDLAARQVIMALPEGLLSINAPMTPEERAERSSRSASE